MAASSVTVTVQQSWVEGKALRVIGTVVFGASPGTYSTGGLTLPLTDPLIKAQRAPISCKLLSQSNAAAQADYAYKYIPGTTNANGLVKIFTGSAEIAASAMPAAVSGDVIQFDALFLGQN